MVERTTIPPNKLESQEPKDKQIREIIGSSQNDYHQMWQSSDFCRAFPLIVQYLISPLGLQQFTSDERTVILQKTLASFAHLPWDKKGDHLPIKAKYLAFTQGGKTDNLMRTEIASTILLGMSLPDNQGIIQDLVEFYLNLPGTTKKSTLRSHLGTILEINNISRAWIKVNELDTKTGHEWDNWTTQLLVRLPDHQNGIPVECEFELTKHFSKSTATVLLQHLLSHVQAHPLTEKASRRIIGFTADLRTYGNDFIRSEPIWPMFEELNKKINEYDFSESGQEPGEESLELIL